MINPLTFYFCACFSFVTFEHTRSDSRVTNERFALVKKVVGFTKHKVHWDPRA